MPHRLRAAAPGRVPDNVYDPPTLKILAEAFDAAWREIWADTSEDHPDQRRAELAMVVLSIANRGDRDVTEIKRRAVRLMRRHEHPTLH